MCGVKSKRWVWLFSVLLFSLWLSSSAAADHVLTDEQYNRLMMDLTGAQSSVQELRTKTSEQLSTIRLQAQTIAQQQQTIESSGTKIASSTAKIERSVALLTEQTAIFPMVSKSFDQAVAQINNEKNVYRTLAFTFAGGLIGNVIGGAVGALEGMGAGAAAGGILWLFRL